jgi:hypothetical protein
MHRFCYSFAAMQESHTSARTLNPEAGEHAISADAGEQAAAEAATRLSWREFPYYAKRYGERGWRFSLSDSGWLQTLCELSPDAARAQMMWLANLLAARGMPRYLMERHLEHLHAELMARLPDRGSRYDFLRVLSAHLRQLRLTVLPAAAFARLSSEFDSRTHGCKDAVKNMGSVIVAAVADDAAGMGSVLANVTEWAQDAGRFEPEWVRAVQATIGHARAALTAPVGSASVR